MTTTKHTLFTDVSRFYQDILTTLQQAEHSIDMIYFAFDQGEWAGKISRVLQQKAADGVQVRLMVDELGMVIDNVKNALRNRALLAKLRGAGVQVDVFRPAGRRLSQANRLHVKICAIDQRIAFVGGSNIGDHYPHWRDSNLRLDGELGNTFAQLYAYLGQFSTNKTNGKTPHLSDLHTSSASLMLTLPGRRQDIRRALLDLILNAEKSITIRTWYFLPDKEIMNALLSQAENGVKVTVIFSHRTRVSFIDAANRFIANKLVKSGVGVYRYKGRYMHGKEAWNDKGDILFGSANVDWWALYSNFECDLQLRNRSLAQQLQQAFVTDLAYCQQHSSGTAWQRTLPRQTVPQA